MDKLLKFPGYSLYLPTSTKKNAQLKVENYGFFGGLAEDLSPEDSLSDRSEDSSEEVREEPVYIGVSATKKSGSWSIKILPLIKENQTSQVSEFSAFLCMGRCKSLDLLTSFL